MMIGREDPHLLLNKQSELISSRQGSRHSLVKGSHPNLTKTKQIKSN